VDDSPAKCVLQPYNHLCVPEYDGTRRHNSGLAKWKEEILAAREKQEGKKIQSCESEGTECTFAPISVGENAPIPEDEASSAGNSNPGRKIKVGKKKTNIADRRVKREQIALETEVEMDDIVLAMIGILETIKFETNVGSWVKQGGVWAGFEEEREILSTEKNPGLNEEEDASIGKIEAGTANPGSVHDSGPILAENITAISSCGMSDVLINKDNVVTGPEIAPEAAAQESSSVDLVSPLSSKFSSPIVLTSPRSLANILSPHRKSTTQLSPLIVNSASAGLYRPPALAGLAAASVVEPEVSTSLPTPIPMWFNSSKVVGFWASKGQDALERLGIELKDGVKPFTS
jgi:hypothetical protein